MEKKKDKTSKQKANMHHEMLPCSFPLNCYIAIKSFEALKLKENFSNPKVDAQLLGKQKERVQEERAKGKNTKSSRRSQKKSRRGTKKNTLRK
jgi:hypothetical protein